MRRKVKAAIAAKPSVRTARRHVGKYAEFSKRFRPLMPPFPVRLEILLDFLFVHVQNNKGSAKSLDKIVRALKYHSEMERITWLDIADAMELKRQLKHLIFIDPVPSQQKAPVTFDLLVRMSLNLDSCKLSDARLLALYWLAYEGALRVDELLGGRRKKDVIWGADGKSCTLLLRRTKTHRSGDPLRVEFSYSPGRHGAAKYLRNWFTLAGLSNATQDSLLFPARNRSQSLSSTWFRQQIKRSIVNIGLQSASFSSHSFRAGLATDLFKIDTPLQTVQWAGRWRSLCALIYYRSNVDKHRKVANAIQAIRQAHV